MKRVRWAAAMGAAFLFVFCGRPAWADPPFGWVAHPPIHFQPFTTTSPAGLVPAQIYSAYLWPTSGFPGFGRTIAIVDAFDDPDIASDLKNFDATFRLPVANFIKATPQGLPGKNAGWALEISLDVEWAHAVSPFARIVLVEAATSSFTNLLNAVAYAKNVVHADVVSMSWGGSEFSGETSFDPIFGGGTATFVAASGDAGGQVIWPSASPLVVSAGGTTLNMRGTTFVSETGWSGSGGGLSAFELHPAYQTGFISATHRATPDVSYDANPNTGVSVFDSVKLNGHAGWWVVGGTSASAPQWAGLYAQSKFPHAGPAAVYAAARLSYHTYFRDITVGSAGSFVCKIGYDLVTGLGSPRVSALDGVI